MKLKFIFLFLIVYLTPLIRDNLYIVIKLTFILSFLIVFFNTYDQG
jgi:hypothetical protein